MAGPRRRLAAGAPSPCRTRGGGPAVATNAATRTGAPIFPPFIGVPHLVDGHTAGRDGFGLACASTGNDGRGPSASIHRLYDTARDRSTRRIALTRGDPDQRVVPVGLS